MGSIPGVANIDAYLNLIQETSMEIAVGHEIFKDLNLKSVEDL